MTKKDDPRLQGRHPEFARMSLRPGIGQTALHEIASTLMQFNLEDTEADVPSCLRHGSRLLPLGRYLRMQLRKMVGKNEKAPQATLDKMASEVLPLRLAARSSAENPSLKGQLVQSQKGSVARLEAMDKIFKQRKSL